MNAARNVKTDLTEYLRELHLPAIRRCFEEQARQAERETLSYEQYLLDLSERECQERRENRIARLLRDSRLPMEKTMENFDLKRLPQKAARQVKALLDGTFLDRKENVLAFGNPGSGKTHLLADLAASEDGLTITLRRSKTDQAGAGRKIGIPRGSTPDTCPVQAIEAWLRAAGITEGALFRTGTVTVL